MLIPFYQVTEEINLFLASVRRRGLAGNIVSELKSFCVGDEQAIWTGERYRLAFCGEPKDFRLEIRENKHGVWSVIREIKDHDRFPDAVLFFVAEEG